MSEQGWGDIAKKQKLTKSYKGQEIVASPRPEGRRYIEEEAIHFLRSYWIVFHFTRFGKIQKTEKWVLTRNYRNEHWSKFKHFTLISYSAKFIFRQATLWRWKIDLLLEAQQKHLVVRLKSVNLPKVIYFFQKGRKSQRDPGAYFNGIYRE